MKRSIERILTTHTGSLPRPADLVDLMYRREEGEAVPQSVVDARVRSAVAEAVAKQNDAGVDVMNDGEQGKIAYSVYVKDCLSGFEGEDSSEVTAFDDDFPEYWTRREFTEATIVRSAIKRPVCTGPIGWKDRQAVQRDIHNLKAALNGLEPEEAFMTAASPGVVAGFLKDRYYGSHEAYVYALADALKDEYDAICRAGFLLQLDCPDLTMSGWRRRQQAGLSAQEFIKRAEAPRGGVEPCRQRHPARPDAAPPMLGKLRGTSSPGYSPQGHHRHRVQGSTRSPLLRERQPSTRA